MLKKAGDGVSSSHDGPLRMYMWFLTQDSDTLRRLCEHSSFMMAFWPLSQIWRLCVQLVGVLRLRCPHGICMFFGGSLLTCPYARSCFSAAQLSCLMLCYFLAAARFPYEGVHAFLLHNLSGDISYFWGRYEISQ